jgi:hypothetical protein
MKTTFTLIMLTRDHVMQETVADVFCQSEHPARIERIAEAMRKAYVGDFKIITKQGRQVIQGPILRSYKVNQCPKCLQEYTYNDLQQAREEEKIDFCDLLCECGCNFMIDWQFDPTKKVRPSVVWTREEPATEPAAAEEPTMVSIATFPNGFQKQAEDYHLSLRHANLNPGFKWEGGDLCVLLPEAEVSCLRTMQKANPARFGNPPEVDASLEETRRLNRADYA